MVADFYNGLKASGQALLVELARNCSVNSASIMRQASQTRKPCHFSARFLNFVKTEIKFSLSGFIFMNANFNT